MRQELAEASAHPAAGALVAGRYRIVELLGVGGMASVWRAADEYLGREVALKQVRAEVADAEVFRRQQDEIRAVAALHHPAVVTLYDAFPDESGGVVLVLQYVQGQDLRTVLDRGKLTPDRVLSIGAALSGALAGVHAAGIAHRDVKPANILIPDADTTAPAAMLSDFGIARVLDDAGTTGTGTVIGTAAYFSPEQATGRPVTSATDVYSLGLVLIECLTGERSFPGSALESASARLSRDPDIPAGLAPGLAFLLRQLTARDPQLRPTAAEAAERFAELSAKDASGLRFGVGTQTPPTAPVVGENPAFTALAATLPLSAESAQGVDARESLLPAAGRSRRAVLAAGIVLAAILAATSTLVLANGTGTPSPTAYPVEAGTLGEEPPQSEEPEKQSKGADEEADRGSEYGPDRPPKDASGGNGSSGNGSSGNGNGTEGGNDTEGKQGKRGGG